MSTETAATAAPKPVKTFGATLTDGAGNKLKFIGVVRKNGSVTTFSQHISPKDAEGKRTVKRGATAEHATLDVARKAQDKLIAVATSEGWARRAGGGGVAARKADSFSADSLPKAKPAPKK